MTEFLLGISIGCHIAHAIIVPLVEWGAKRLCLLSPEICKEIEAIEEAEMEVIEAAERL